MAFVLKQTVQAELDARRADWAQSLDQLAQYTDSLEKELIKMAGNMRRSRTEILHLSVRWANQVSLECVCESKWADTQVCYDEC